MGHFIGKVKTEWLDDGRDMKMLELFRYVDDKGVVWFAKTGDIVNGASIPRFFWRVIGSPFVGKFRKPSVIHDVYCGKKTMPWQKVHKCFYEMMKETEVSRLRRYLMFKAVWYFGPRW